MTVSMAMRILVIISPATLTAPVRHPLGEENFSKKLSRASMAPTTPQNVWRVPMTGVLFEHLFHPADLFSEGFGLALLKFPEVYQLPLDAWQFQGMGAMQ